MVIAGPRSGPRAPIAVAVSNDPETRIRQSMSFWRRNPGFFKTFALFDAMRGALELTGVGRLLNRWFAPTVHGHGQPMVDQMRWQINSRRQPDNPWWMTVNSRLVGDGLLAEAYLRARRASELTGKHHQAWLAYIMYSDMSRRALGLPVGAGYRAPGAVDNLSRPDTDGATSDAYRGASILDRLEVQLVYKPLARKAYWVAHDESIQAGKQESHAILDRYRRRFPQEAAFGSAWANTIRLFRVLAPPAAGHFAIWMQRNLLPQYQPVDSGTPTAMQRAFVKLISFFDHSFPPDAALGAAQLAAAPALAPAAKVKPGTTRQTTHR